MITEQTAYPRGKKGRRRRKRSARPTKLGRYGPPGISVHLEGTGCIGVGEPTVDKTDPGWRLRPWGLFLIVKGEPTVDKTDPEWRLKPWESGSYE